MCKNKKRRRNIKYIVQYEQKHKKDKVQQKNWRKNKIGIISKWWGVR